MTCPTHPGEILKEDVLPELGITVTEAAKQLGVTRVAFSRVINGKAGISPDMTLHMDQYAIGLRPLSSIAKEKTKYHACTNGSTCLIIKSAKQGSTPSCRAFPS